MEKQNRAYIRQIGFTFQWVIVAMVGWGGYTLYRFSEQIMSGALPTVQRPPLVEGFLPIGALMSLKLWVTEGLFDPIHPAGLVIFTSALLMAVLLKKSFCGWVCPVGTVSKTVYKTGARIFGKNFVIHRYIDYPLRSIKYLLMGMFLIAIGRMATVDIMVFQSTAYWKVSDIKMLFFFTQMSQTTLIVLLALFVLSLLYKNFWCRYLCPYGGLLGLLSIISPIKITRNEEHCIHCKTCTKNCPSLIPVEEKTRIWSPECMGCLTCVSKCPAKGALDMSLPKRKPLHPLVYALLVMLLFFGIVGAAKMTGKWHSAVTPEQYVRLAPIIHKLNHP